MYGTSSSFIHPKCCLQSTFHNHTRKRSDIVSLYIQTSVLDPTQTHTQSCMHLQVPMKINLQKAAGNACKAGECQTDRLRYASAVEREKLQSRKDPQLHMPQTHTRTQNTMRSCCRGKGAVLTQPSTCLRQSRQRVIPAHAVRHAHTQGNQAQTCHILFRQGNQRYCVEFNL